VDGDELIGVPFFTAVRVIGVADSHLRRWNRVGLVIPSQVDVIGIRRYWTYALEDLVQGRVVKQLEERDCHINTVRRVVEAMRSSTSREPLPSVRWASGPGGVVYVGFPDGRWVNGLEPAAGVVTEVVDLEEIRSDARGAIRRPPESAGRTQRRRAVLANKELFEGTRIPVSAVLAYLRRSLPDDRILQAFPDLRQADIDLARERLRVWR
jgi:DNA-binding transcriptional MerR regulator